MQELSRKKTNLTRFYTSNVKLALLSGPQLPPGLTQAQSSNIFINAKAESNDIAPLTTNKSFKNRDRVANELKMAYHRDMVGKLLYIGRLVSPIVTIHAPHAATNGACLREHHLAALNDTLRLIENNLCSTTYAPSFHTASRL